MQLGICVHPTMLVTLPSREQIDFIEGHVQQFLLPEHPDEAFEPHLQSLRACGKMMPACNSLFPPELKLTGPDIETERIDRYVAMAMRRAAQSGIRWVVVGSGAARSAPPGWSAAQASDQFVQLLRRLAPVAQSFGVTMLVEPLQRGECNFLNTVQQGAEVVRRVGTVSVQLLVDIFHMLRNGERPDDILRVGHLVRHVHVAENADRSPPGVHQEDFRPFLQALQAIGYSGRLTIEAVWTDLPTQLAPALASLRTQLKEVGY